jgi:adhesin/invasin
MVAAAAARKNRFDGAALFVFALFAGIACSGDSLILPQDGEPAAVVILGGDGQADTVGRVLRDSLVVRITDRVNRPIKGQAVYFEPQSGTGAHAIPDTAQTDADGRARVRWVLGTLAGPESIRARIGGSGGALKTVFHATALTGAADTIFVTSGDSQAGVVGSDLGQPLVATVTDRYGNPVSGVLATWTPVGGGSVSPTTTLSDLNGQVAVRRTLGPLPGDQQTIVASAGLNGSPIVFVQTSSPGPPASLIAESGDNQSGLPGQQLANPLVVHLVDAMGNGIAGRAVTWPVATGGGTITPTSGATDVTGHASATWTLGPLAGPNIVIPSSAGLTTTFTAISTPTQPTAISAISPTQLTGTAGGSASPPPSVRVTDARGQPVAGVPVTFAVIDGGGSVAPAVVSTDLTGSATVGLWTLGSRAGTNTLTASASGTSGALSGSPVRFTAISTAGTMSRLAVVVQPSPAAVSGVPLPQPPTVQLQDAGGNDVAASGVVVTATIVGSPPGASLTSATATTSAAGSATFNGLTLTGPASTYTLLFTSSPPLVGATSDPIVLSGAVGARLGLSIQPSATVISGQPFPQQPVLQVLDAGGNPVSQPGVVCSVTLASGAPALTGTPTATTDAAGVAAFTDLAISGSPGLRTLRFSATGLASVTSSTIDVRPAQTISILVQPSATVVNGATFAVQPAVLVVDQNGLPIAGVLVGAIVMPGGAILGGQSTIRTDVLGVATFSNLSLTGTVGSYTLTVSSAVASVTTTAIGLTPGPASASRSTANVPNHGKVQRQTLITVQTRDQSGNALTTGGHTIEITVTGQNRVGPFAANDNGDGGYSASYTPTRKGKDSIAITLDGTPIAGSPFSSDVH